MFDFISNLITPVGPVGFEVSPLMSVVGVALEPPMIYFIGLALIGGVIMIVKRIKG